jgi:hypothetical protein
MPDPVEDQQEGKHYERKFTYLPELYIGERFQSRLNNVLYRSVRYHFVSFGIIKATVQEVSTPTCVISTASISIQSV